MTVTYPLALPDEKFVRTRLIMFDGVSVTGSPFTGQEESQDNDISIWSAEIELARMTADRARAWSSFLAKLRGQHGSFLLGNTGSDVPAGSAALDAGAPVTDGVQVQGAFSLNVTGLPATVTGYLVEGDYIQLGSGADSRLYMVTNDVDSDGAGAAAIDIWPRLRVAYPDASAITVSACRGVFRLAKNSREIDIDRGLVYGVAFDAVEDMR